MLRPVNPTTGEPLEPIPCTPLEEIPDRISAARRAQPAWDDLGYERRRALILAARETLRERVGAISGWVHAEMGKLPAAARGEVEAYLRGIEGDLDTMAKALVPEELPFEGGVTRVHHVPHGVAAIVTPWNFPVGMPLTLLVPALAAGNTVVFKPSEISTRTGLAVADAFRAHLPEGVLQVVAGADAEGAALVSAEVDLIAFIGSREVGKKILEAASRRAARVLLEMGGKDAMVVASDANLDAAAAFATRGSFSNAGQVCCSVERIYVEAHAEGAFLEKLLSETRKVVVGEAPALTEAGKTPPLCIGPLASEQQLHHVERNVQEAVRMGARLLAGGRRRGDRGNHFEPTVLAGVRGDMAIMREETFGPVACVQSVASIEEGIRLANDTRYGLTATLWTGDEARGRQIALRLEAGCIGVNRSFGGAHDMPWAGTKESGYGHTRGVSGMRHFLQPRSVTTR